MLYDLASTEVLGVAASPLSLYQSEDGTAEQQVHWWSNGLTDALSQIDKKLRSRVAAIGVSGQQHGFVPLNSAGEALAPVKLWCDTSTEKECQIIMERLGGVDACINSAGNPILPGYTASKVLWFRNEHPALYREMDSILLPHDYLNFYLTGERCMEAGDASGTGFFNVTERAWSNAVLQAIDENRDLNECLPDVRTANQEIGRLNPRIAGILGLPEGIPVSIGGGDNMMGAIGTGNVNEGTITISLGTSGTVYAHSDSPVIDANGQIAAFCSSTGGWLPLLCTMNCTVSTELTRDMLNLDLTEFEFLVDSVPKGSGGILTLPFFNGERTPNLPHAKGCFVGVDSQNAKPENFLRSSVEGATFALRFGLDELTKLGHSSTEIVLTGGGVKSRAWRQIVADIFNMPVKVLEEEEGAAFGAALQAAEVISGESIESLTANHLKEDGALGCLP
ncbi:MAG: xylulokinase, partial [Gammaproteobacteria bacterium]|nr:xylulokinase [Gammaproteobacteria bacterium]